MSRRDEKTVMAVELDEGQSGGSRPLRGRGDDAAGFDLADGALPGGDSCGLVWVGTTHSWYWREVCDRRAGIEPGVLTVAEGRAVGQGCPYQPDVRASRYAVTRAAGTAGAAVTLSTQSAEAWAARRWLVMMLAFDRAEGCWVVLARDDHGDQLVVIEINDELTDPRTAAPAQQWAAEWIEEESSDVTLCELDGCGKSMQLRVSEWRTVWLAGLRGYAALFVGTQSCHIPVSDLDPATGSACFCLKREGGA
jgi:hypothetical protein